MRYGALAPMVALAFLVIGCGAVSSPVAPSEAFNWGHQPISFTPPSDAWRREGELSGGLRGVRFIKTGSVGEAITVAEYHSVGDRDRREALQKLLQADVANRREFRKALQLARSRTDQPYSALETEVAEAVNAALDRATLLHVQRTDEGIREEIEAALAQAERLRFSLDDVIDSVVFRPERRNEPERYRVLDRRDTTIAGEPAVVVDYTVETPDRLFHAREAYVVFNNCLFVANFIGLKENLGLFDRVVASIKFEQ